MMLLPCPWCGPRNVSEFQYLGEDIPRPDPNHADRGEWRGYLYFRENPRGWTTELWHHNAGCRQHFRLERDTLSNDTDPSTSPPRASAGAVPTANESGGATNR